MVRNRGEEGGGGGFLPPRRSFVTYRSCSALLLFHQHIRDLTRMVEISRCGCCTSSPVRKFVHEMQQATVFFRLRYAQIVFAPVRA